MSRTRRQRVGNRNPARHPLLPDRPLDVDRDGRGEPDEGREFERASDVELLAKIKSFLELALAGHWKDEQGPAEWRCSPVARELTVREVEVVEHLLHGASNREIADLCNVTVATVKAHFFNIFGKTGVSSRTELVTRLLGH